MVKTIIQEQVPAYLQAGVPEKSRIVSSICQVTGMHRKAVLRALRREQCRSRLKVSVRLGRPRVFTAETDAALAFVWEQYDYPCAERLHPMVEPSASSGVMVCGATVTRQPNNCWP